MIAPLARVVAYRSAVGIRRGFHDWLEVFGTNGRHAAFSSSTVPWSRGDGRTRRAAHLAPGDYVARPARANASGHFSPTGKPMFLLTDRSGSTRLPTVEGFPAAGVFSIYAETMMEPHIGCQTLRPADWPRFRALVGGGSLSFVYSLRDASAALGVA